MFSLRLLWAQTAGVRTNVLISPSSVGSPVIVSSISFNKCNITANQTNLDQHRGENKQQQWKSAMMPSSTLAFLFSAEYDVYLLFCCIAGLESKKQTSYWSNPVLSESSQSGWSTTLPTGINKINWTELFHLCSRAQTCFVQKEISQMRISVFTLLPTLNKLNKWHF